MIISTRSITAEDLPTLAQIYVRSLDAARTDERWTNETAYALLKNWYDRQPDLFFLAETENGMAGAFVVGVRPWWDGNHLVDGELFVDPQHQKHGVASALIRAVLQKAIEKYDPLNWDTYTFNEDAFPLTWYKQLGFQLIEEWVLIRAKVPEVLSKISN